MHKGIIVEDLKPAADILMRFCQRSGAVGISAHFLNAEDALAYLDEHRVDVARSSQQSPLQVRRQPPTPRSSIWMGPNDAASGY